jgi:hypothetical protein
MKANKYIGSFGKYIPEYTVAHPQTRVMFTIRALRIQDLAFIDV